MPQSSASSVPPSLPSAYPSQGNNNDESVEHTIVSDGARRIQEPSGPSIQQQARQDQGMRGILHKSYSEVRRSFSTVADLLQEFNPARIRDVPEEFIRDLPHDIQVLRKMANRPGSRSPEVTDRFAKVFGFETIDDVARQSFTPLGSLLGNDDGVETDRPRVESNAA